MQKRAIILANKRLVSTPRVLKQIRWLEEVGYAVDTLGIGPSPLLMSCGKHYAVRDRVAILRYLSYATLRGFSRARYLFHYPAENFGPKNFGDYTLVILHDLTYLSLPALVRDLHGNVSTKVMIDLHENHLSPLSRSAIEEVAFSSFHKWQLQSLLDFASEFRSRLVGFTVASREAKIYADALGIEIRVLRNTPQRSNILPSQTHADDIKLVYHGVATKGRGLRRILIAMTYLPKKFSLWLQISNRGPFVAQLRVIAVLLGLSARVRFIPPVAPDEISSSINKYDIAMIVLPPITENQAHTMPGKFFESIQAGLAVVSGPTPSLANICNSLGLGLVLDGWSPKDIARGVCGLDSTQIMKMKHASYENRFEFSDEKDRVVFLQALNLL